MSEAPVPRALADKLAEFTIRFGSEREPQTLVVAEPGDSLEVAFRLAREELRNGRAVRIIGEGVTLRRVWPDWVPSSEGLILTELGALQYDSQVRLTGQLQDEMRAWVRTTLRDAFGEVPADRVLFAAACGRFLQQIIVAYPAARAIAQAFPGSTVRCVSDGTIAQLLEQFGCVRPPHDGHSRRTIMPLRRAARMAAFGAAAAVVAVARLFWSFLDARESFNALPRYRRTAPDVDTWVALVPDWYRINHHLLDALAIPLVEAGKSIGVILVGGLPSGQRDEQVARKHHPSDRLWPGLGRLGEYLDACAVDQAVMPESFLAWSSAIGRGLCQSVRILRHLAFSPVLSLPSVDIDLREHTFGLAAWATIDLLRASLAHSAIRNLCARTSWTDKSVVLIATNSPQLAIVDQVLQRAGAKTFDHTHGAGLDNWSGHASSESAIRCVWTAADARSAAAPGISLLVAGMPVRFRVPPRSAPPRRILVMSNYVHRDSPIGGRYPYEIFQQELLDVIARLRASGHAGLEFRWRPHPADMDELLRHALAKYPGVALSRGVKLEDDAAWADVIVSSYSTVVLEALFAGVPIFLHARPEFWRVPATDFIDDDRIFFHAEDGAEKVGRWIRRFDKAGASALGPERRARLLLFGPSEEPVPMHVYFGTGRKPLPLVETLPRPLEDGSSVPNHRERTCSTSK